MKRLIVIFFLTNSLSFSQEKTIREFVSELNLTKLVIKDNFIFSGNILDSKLECKNYYYSKKEKDSTYLFSLKEDSNFIAFLPVGNYYIDENFKNISQNPNGYYGSIAPSDLLIYNKKADEFYYIKCLASGSSKYSKEGIEYDLYFEIYPPIMLLDNKLNPKYYFFDTEEDGDINLAYYEILFFENYFQINSFAQKERKKINIQDLKFDDLEEVCTKETVLIKKEYFKYNKIDIFNIYNQKMNKQLLPHFPRVEN